MKTLIKFYDFDRLEYNREFEIPAMPLTPAIRTNVWIPLNHVETEICDQIWKDYQEFREKNPGKTLQELRDEHGPIGPLPFIYCHGDTLHDVNICDFSWVVNVQYHYTDQWVQTIWLSDNPDAHTAED
jgi:hypothetical protein